MLAARLAGVPVLVGHDRWRCGRMAMARFDPRVIVLDDGLQHQALARDLEIVLLDHERPLGNGWLLPAGPLRETPAALGRADALILTRSPSFSGPLPRGLPLPAVGSPAPVFRTRYLASSFLAGAAGCGPQGGRGAAVAAFSGIARNEDFVRTVAAMGHRVAAFLPYPDHHAYSAGDLAAIGRAARRCGAAMIATTEKDYARLGRRSRWPLPLLVVGVRPQFDPAGPSYPEFIAAGLERALCRKGSPAPRSVIPR
jgi:tetraacyldisaccharide 4'-kinase